jgi:sugar lactone lactonase YvrE
MTSKLITLVLLFLTTTLAHPGKKHDVDLPLPAKTVAQAAAPPAWLENIAVRANGDLLVNQLAPAPVLYTVKNPFSTNATLDPIYQWKETNVSILTGITETYPDTFFIGAGNATAGADGYPGTFSVWEAKFSSSESSQPTVRKIANVPAAKFVNGIVSLPDRPEILLIADSQYGLVFRLDTRTGKSEVIADRPEFKPYPERQNKTVGFGINGVKIRGGHLYFSNSNLVTIFRVSITQNGYISKKGNARVEKYADLSVATTFVDDFTFGDDGTLWAASNDGNTVVRVSPNGKKVEGVAGSRYELTIAGGTAAAFGRTKEDRDVLYVSTAGGLDLPINGTVFEAGKVVAVNTKGGEC